MGDILEKKKKKKIVIDKILTGGASGEPLKGCYFMFRPKDDTYDFFDKDDKVKAGDIQLGHPFWFTLDEMPKVNWTLSITSSEHDPNHKLNGTWGNSADPVLEDGSYQAQAGGSGAEEDASAASAGYSG